MASPRVANPTKRKSSAITVIDKLDTLVSNDKTSQLTLALYDAWASSYEQDLNSLEGGYRNPLKIAECLCRLLPEKSARILDVACGTGLIGQELRSKGYTCLHGLDGSEKMLDVAKGRGLYDHYFCALVGSKKIADVEDGSYDAITTSGAFLPGHMDAQCLRTLGRAVRPGGFVFIGVRESILDHPAMADLEPRMKELERDGFWRLEHRARFDNCCNGSCGLEFAFRKL